MVEYTTFNRAIPVQLWGGPPVRVKGGDYMKTKIQKLNDENKVIAEYDNIMVAAKRLKVKKTLGKLLLLLHMQ